MLTKDQRLLLENALEALNRLYDRDSTVTDVHALFLATAAALRGTELVGAFELPTRRLGDLIRSGASRDEKRDLALNATDDLRGFIADELRRDAVENPRRRHS